MAYSFFGPLMNKPTYKGYFRKAKKPQQKTKY